MKADGRISPVDIYSGGLDIGAVSVKWVCRKVKGETKSTIRLHEGNPKETVLNLFDEEVVDAPFRIVCTGQASRMLLDLPYRSETECLEKALAHHRLKPDILLSLGGESFSVYPVKDGTIRNIISSSKCAAGTGEFIVQQFQRMGMTLSEGIGACENGNIVELATRCSVHCKSDATHKLNKGECRRADIALTLVYDLATKVREMIELAQWPTGIIVVAGGLSQNRIFIDHLRTLLPDSKVMVLPESPFLEAFGASLFAQTQEDLPIFKESRSWIGESSVTFDRLESLKAAEPLLDYRVRKNTDLQIIGNRPYILGVDAGSTTTKAVLLDYTTGCVGASCYLRTLGNPIAAVKACMEDLNKQVGDNSIDIVQAGVTGSGREMVSVFLDNCLSFNEILAHARAAAQEVPDVDTVFEIGGQDSKFISFLNGIPVDYAMNEGCSAGTGSFLEESASIDMGISVTDIAFIAEKSQSPIAFGERCAAFINTDLRNALQQGSEKADVVAGLVYSIAENYMSRVVGPRYVGKNLLFLGGVALNRAVGLAIAARVEQKIVVPPHPELMGAVGAAFMAKDRLADSRAAEASISLQELIQGEMLVKGTFRCKACDNHCEIQRIRIRDHTFPFGGLCARYAIMRHKGGRISTGRDLVAERNALMFEDFKPDPVDKPRGAIGLPMALTTYELFPFYARLISELGYNLIFSEPSKAGNKKTLSSICYPGEIVHGAVYDLLNRGVDFIFLPHVIELMADGERRHSYTCPSTAIIPDLVKAAFPKHKEKILSPHIGLSTDLIETTLCEIERMGSILGLKEMQARDAGEKALSHYQAYRTAYCNLGEKALEELGEQPAIILAGRPYSVYAAEVNLALPQKIASRGYHVIPVDMLPPATDAVQDRDVWHFTQQISNAVAHVKQHSNLFICLVSCFSCGPDASMYHLFREALSGNTFCYLEIDSHTAHAGFETRISAFLDIIEEKRRHFSR